MPNRHVVQNADGGWDVKEPNNPVPTSSHRTQLEAEGAARAEIAAAGGGELIVHNREGQIREKETIAARD